MKFVLNFLLMILLLSGIGSAQPYVTTIELGEYLLTGVKIGDLETIVFIYGDDSYSFIYDWDGPSYKKNDDKITWSEYVVPFSKVFSARTDDSTNARLKLFMDKFDNFTQTLSNETSWIRQDK